jgi:predicted PurR-regulated permease PerM
MRHLEPIRVPEEAAIRGRGAHSARRATRWADVLPLAAALALGIAVPALIYSLARPLALLVLAFTIAQALSPLADRLASRLPRPLAATLLYLLILGGLALLLSSVVPTFFEEARQLVSRGPELLERVQTRIGSWLPISGTSARDGLISVLQNFENTLLRLPMQALGALFDALVVTFLSLYLLIAGPRLKRFALSLMPRASACAFHAS